MINITKRNADATNELMVRVDKLSGDIKKLKHINGSMSFSLDEISEKLKMADFMYDVILTSVAQMTNTTISFDGNRVLFTPK